MLTASRIIGMTVGLAALNSWGISEFQRSQARDPNPLPHLGLSFADYIEQLKLWEHRRVEAILTVLSYFFLVAAIACVLAIIPSLFLLGKKSRRETG